MACLLILMTLMELSKVSCRILFLQKFILCQWKIRLSRRNRICLSPLLHDSYLPVLTAALWAFTHFCGRWFTFNPTTPFSTDETLQTYRYSISISLNPPIETFTTKIFHATITGSNNRHSVRNPLVRRKFHANRFFPRSAYFADQTPDRMLLQPMKSLQVSRVKRYLSYIES